MSRFTAYGKSWLTTLSPGIHEDYSDWSSSATRLWVAKIGAIHIRRRTFRKSTFDSTKLHEVPGIQFQASTAVVTVDTEMDTSWRDPLVRTHIPNNVERGEQTASTSFNIYAKTKEILMQSFKCF